MLVALLLLLLPTLPVLMVNEISLPVCSHFAAPSALVVAHSFALVEENLLYFGNRNKASMCDLPRPEALSPLAVLKSGASYVDPMLVSSSATHYLDVIPRLNTISKANINNTIHTMSSQFNRYFNSTPILPFNSL